MRSGRGRCEIETLPAVRSSNIFYVFISTMIFLLVIHLRSTLIPKHVTAERAYESLLSLLLTGAVFADHLTDMSGDGIFIRPSVLLQWCRSKASLHTVDMYVKETHHTRYGRYIGTYVEFLSPRTDRYGIPLYRPILYITWYYYEQPEGAHNETKSRPRTSKEHSSHLANCQEYSWA